MSRAIDLLLLVLIAGAAWLLLRPGSEPVRGADRPIEATVRVTGDASLDGLELVVLPIDELESELDAEGGRAPRQITAFDLNRSTRIEVPRAGRYRIAFAASGAAETVDLEHAHVLDIDETALVDVLEVPLAPDRAAALRAQR